MGRTKRAPHIDVARRGEIYGIKNPYRLLACGVICRAWLDYRALKDVEECVMDSKLVTRKELDEFFKGRWCELLLSGTPFDGEYIKERALCVNG